MVPRAAERGDPPSRTGRRGPRSSGWRVRMRTSASVLTAVPRLGLGVHRVRTTWDQR